VIEDDDKAETTSADQRWRRVYSPFKFPFSKFSFDFLSLDHTIQPASSPIDAIPVIDSNQTD
jgi:hypothetical protein